MSKLLGVFTLALCVPAALLAAQNERSGQDDPSGRRDPRQRLVGQYEIVEGAKDGEAIPKDRLNNTVAITRDTIAVVDREKKELYSAKYELRRGGERGLWQIDMESKVPEEGAKAVGLLKREGEQLWLIYDLNGVRPENFDKTAKGQHLFKMKRKADEPSLNEPTDEEDDGSGT